MANKIEVEWVAQSQQMNATLERLNEKLDKQDKKLEQIAKTSKKAADAAAGSFSALTQELKEAEDALKAMAQGTDEFEKQKAAVDRLRQSVSAAKQQMVSTTQVSFGQKVLGSLQAMDAAKNIVLGYVEVLDNLRQKNEEIIVSASDATLAIEAQTKAMQVQMGLTNQQAEVQTAEVLQAAKQAGVRPDVAFTAQTQLSSSDFESGVLDTMIKIMQATNFQGRPEEVVQGVAQVLNAYQLNRDNTNTERLGSSLVTLFRDTDLQMQDLGDFAKNAAVFENAGLKLEQSLAAFASLRNIYTGEASGTGLRNFVGILQSAGGQKTQTDALASMGLQPQQVDFVGEDLPQVIRTLRDAVSKMAPEEANVAMAKIFGRENVAVAQTLLNMDDEIARFESAQGEITALHEKALVIRESKQADINRKEIERIESQMSRDDEIHQLRLQMIDRENYILDRQEKSAITSDIGGGLASATGYATRLLDMIPGVGVQQGYDFAAAFTGEGIVNQIAGLLRDQNAETKLLRQDIQNLRNNNNPRMPAGRPKEDPLPAATTP